MSHHSPPPALPPHFPCVHPSPLPQVGVDSLLSALGTDGDSRNLSKRLKAGGKEELEVRSSPQSPPHPLTLPQVPLEKPAADRVARAAGYVGVKKEISVWDAVVHSRRAADQVPTYTLSPVLACFPSCPSSFCCSVSSSTPHRPFPPFSSNHHSPPRTLLTLPPYLPPPPGHLPPPEAGPEAEGRHRDRQDALHRQHAPRAAGQT